MLENLNKSGGIVHSQRVLLALTQAGGSREDAYRVVQKNAMRAWQGGGISRRCCAAMPKCARRPARSKSRRCSTWDINTKAADAIFARVFA